jgi:hypothetical protein
MPKSAQPECLALDLLHRHNDRRLVMSNGVPLQSYREQLSAIVNENGACLDPQEFLNRVMTLIEIRERRKQRRRPANAEIVQDLDTAISALNKVINTIREDLLMPRLWLSDCGGDLGDLWTDEGLVMAESEGEAMLETQREAILAGRSLQKIVVNLERQKEKFPTKKGRPQADEDRLVFALGKLFQKHIGEPTSYDSAAFYRVVRVVLDACGLPSTDPRRPIASALTTLRTRQTSLTKSQE